MKKLLILLLAIPFSVCTMAQGNKHSNEKGNKHKDKEKHERDNEEQENKDHDKLKKSHEDESEVAHYPTKHHKTSKHQPKKVTAALLSDYPNATNIVWKKYKGDYTATFTNGLHRPIAIYHANGQRRDTRTHLTRQELPGTIWDGIFKRDNITPIRYVQIERPSIAQNIFRILTANNVAYYYDENGNKVSYNY